MNTNLLQTAIGLVFAATACAAQGAPVIYTLRTVADGTLGAHSFQQARVVIRLTSDTRAVHEELAANGDSVQVNRAGAATVSVTVGASTWIANLKAGEIYVRYDPLLGIAGFGSALGETYPVALGCANVANAGTYTADCKESPVSLTGSAQNDATGSLSTGTANSLSDPTATPYLSAATLALPRNLTATTLLTGMAHTCAGPYGIALLSYDTNVDGLTTCPATAVLATSLGGFALKDSTGFSRTVELYGAPGDFDVDHFSNVGTLQVEVLGADD